MRELPSSHAGPSQGPTRSIRTWSLPGGPVTLGRRTWVMAVLNCTPDSFYAGSRSLDYAGSRSLDEDAAARRLEAVLQEGADCVDVGGESTRPGADPVPWDEEWRRVRPVFQAARRLGCRQPLSIDTTKHEVATRALELGAAVVNDVSGLRQEPRLADLAAEARAGLVVMHMRGNPRTMQSDTVYDDVVAEVVESLRGSERLALERGVAPEQIVLDPGIGFAKTAEHNLEILRRLSELSVLERPVLVGASRKSFLGKIQGGSAPEDRLEASLAAHVAAVLGGAHVIRTHDVRATVRAVRVADAVMSGNPFGRQASGL